jgi:UDP-glucuronate decarboxylase
METNTVILNDLKFIINSNITWSKLENKTILISGANGFLASYIVKAILYKNTIDNLNCKVIALVRNIENAVIRFQDFLQRIDLVIINHDIINPILISDTVDFVIHAASQASPKYYGIDPIGTIQANTLGTYNLLQFAKNKNVESFLFFSSGEVYGIVDEKDIPTKEHQYGYIDPINVRSCYAESKRLGENMCVSFYHQYNIPIKIVRPFHTYGPGINLEDGRVFADFISNIIKKEDILLHSDGSAKRAFCYISEASVAFFKILLEGKNAEAYNVGNPFEEYSMLDLANMLIKLKPEYNLQVVLNNQKNVNINYLKSPLSRNSPDISKMNQLNWIPKITAKEGFSKAIDSFLIN